jgi:hypothetical protein
VLLAAAQAEVVLAVEEILEIAVVAEAEAQTETLQAQVFRVIMAEQAEQAEAVVAVCLLLEIMKKPTAVAEMEEMVIQLTLQEYLPLMPAAVVVERVIARRRKLLEAQAGAEMEELPVAEMVMTEQMI